MESAEGGTLFLDEIDALPPPSQAKILRLIQEGEYRVLGNPKVWHANVRYISATNIDMLSAVRDRKFRDDLFYRIALFTLPLPPLRDRPEDIPLLAKHFLNRFRLEHGKGSLVLSGDAMAHLHSYSWPGNVRELEHAVHRAVILADGLEIRSCHLELPSRIRSGNPTSFSEEKRDEIRRFEQNYVERMLTTFKGNITQSASAAGLDRKSFYRLIRKHRIDVSRFRGQEDVDAIKACGIKREPCRIS